MFISTFPWIKYTRFSWLLTNFFPIPFDPQGFVVWHDVNGTTGEDWIGSVLFVAFVRLSIFRCANLIFGSSTCKQQFCRIKQTKRNLHHSRLLLFSGSTNVVIIFILCSLSCLLFAECTVVHSAWFFFSLASVTRKMNKTMVWCQIKMMISLSV